VTLDGRMEESVDSKNFTYFSLFHRYASYIHDDVGNKRTLTTTTTTKMKMKSREEEDRQIYQLYLPGNNNNQKKKKKNG